MHKQPVRVSDSTGRTGRERRRYPRYDLECPVQVIDPDGDMVITALTTNISDGGLRFPMPSECVPECGREVLLHLTLRRRRTGRYDIYHSMARILRHSPEDEYGVSEVAVEFSQPMDLKLQYETAEAILTF